MFIRILPELSGTQLCKSGHAETMVYFLIASLIDTLFSINADTVEGQKVSFKSCGNNHILLSLMREVR